MQKTDTVLYNEVFAYIKQANDLELQEIMDAVERRFALAYPQWDVFYAAVHKEPALRKKELEELTAYIEKDILWNEQNQKKDSLR